MNHRSISCLCVAILLLASSCKRFTEITPKGANILSQVSDLDMLLNYNYSAGDANSAQTAFSPNDVGNLVNDTYAYSTNIPALIQSKEQTLNYAYTVYDESVDRKVLSITDSKYEKMYFIINNVCNVVLKYADQAAGDRALATQYKAEAYVLRAYLHYLLVNLYAKGYDPATAATDGGIPYVREDNVLAEPNPKNTVAEVYDYILADIERALALDGLPKIPKNKMRVGLGFAYAAKAQVLLTMRQLEPALEAAEASLAINNAVHDDRLFAPLGSEVFGKPIASAEDNLFFMGAQRSPSISSPSLETTQEYYEPGNIINSYVQPYYPMGNPFSGLEGSKLWLSSGTVYAVNTAGLTTSDTYLIKAECLMRMDKTDEGMDMINHIRKRRIHPDIYEPAQAVDEAEAMAWLKRTWRTEGLYSMRNFINFKRWNTDPAYQQTIEREINGTVYSLSSASPLWIFPFPQNALSYNNALTHNY